MLSWECTIEDELEIKKEEGLEEGIERGLLEAATRLLEKGMSFQDVTDTLKLSDSLIMKLKNATA